MHLLEKQTNLYMFHLHGISSVTCACCNGRLPVTASWASTMAWRAGHPPNRTVDFSNCVALYGACPHPRSDGANPWTKKIGQSMSDAGHVWTLRAIARSVGTCASITHDECCACMLTTLQISILENSCFGQRPQFAHIHFASSISHVPSPATKILTSRTNINYRK
jgi:hypothetical protein